MPSCLANSKRLVSMLASESGVLYSQWKKIEANQTVDQSVVADIEREEAVKKCKTPVSGRRNRRCFCGNDGLKRPFYE
jgi:hypothetical protein